MLTRTWYSGVTGFNPPRRLVRKIFTLLLLTFCAYLLSSKYGIPSPEFSIKLIPQKAPFGVFWFFYSRNPFSSSRRAFSPSSACLRAVALSIVWRNRLSASSGFFPASSASFRTLATSSGRGSNDPYLNCSILLSIMWTSYQNTHDGTIFITVKRRGASEGAIRSGHEEAEKGILVFPKPLAPLPRL